jgi:AsmA protein
MSRCRFRALWTIPLGFILTPMLLWVAIVIAAPTSWARNQFARAIEKSTGRSVHVEALSVCLLGGLNMTNLEIGAPGSIDDPWLHVGELNLDLSPFSVLRGHLRPGQLDVNDMSLRILRRPDGTLELSDLVRPETHPTGATKGKPDCCALGVCLTGTHRLHVGIHHANVEVIDRLNDTDYKIEDVDGELTFEGKTSGTLAINGRLNGGTFQLSGRFDKTMKQPSFDMLVAATDVSLDDDLRGLRYVIPVLSGEQSRYEGKLSGQVAFQARGSDVATLSKSLRGRGFVSLAPIRLHGSSLLDALCKVVDVPPAKVSESIRSQFSIEDERVTTNSSTLQLGTIPVKFSGWTNFKGELDYRVNAETVVSRIPDQALRFLRDFDVDVDKIGELQIDGTLDHLVVRVDGEPIEIEGAGDGSKPHDDRERLRMMGRKLLERVVR